MAEQRPFRFRLPWLSAATAPAPPPPRPTAPAPPPPRPTAPAAPRPAAQAPAQPTTTAFPSQRPPFRPAGIAPPQPTPQETRTEPQLPQPSRAAIEPRVASQPSSPSRPTQTRAASVPPSPSRGDTDVRVISEPVSPTRAATVTQPVSQTKFPSQAATQPRAASLPPSLPPLRFAFQTTGQTSPQPSSPMRRATQVQPTARAVSQPPSPPKKAVEEHVKEGISGDQKKVTQELVKEEKSNGPTDEEEMRRAVTKLLTAASGSETQTREVLRATFQREERKQAEQEISERKKPLISSISDEKQIKTVSATHLKDRERAPLHKEVRDDFLKFAHKLAMGHPKQPTDGKPASIITVAGENRGASMHVGSESAKKDGSVPIHRGYKMNSSEIPESTTTDGEGSSKKRIPRDHITKKDQATRTYVNSNTQSINNSILFSSSVTERNPGVQLALSHNPEGAIKSTTESESFETRKAQFSVTSAENLTYQPTVRRRCLRGLFLEPSDSDPDNPDKPRRHGCLYNCGEKSKDEEVGVP